MLFHEIRFKNFLIALEKNLFINIPRPQILPPYIELSSDFVVHFFFLATTTLQFINNIKIESLFHRHQPQIFCCLPLTRYPVLSKKFYQSGNLRHFYVYRFYNVDHFDIPIKVLL